MIDAARKQLKAGADKLLKRPEAPKPSVPKEGDFGARPAAPIVPPANIAGQALALVVGIMTCLACLTLGTVTLIDASATTWQSQISREATIQIRPADGLDMDAALNEAKAVAESFAGVTSARIISNEESAALLEPWLGSGLDMQELPVPRLVVVTVDERNPPDFGEMKTTIAETVRNASLDDHRAWVTRLVSMARTTTWIGIFILALVLSALVMTVIFATRGAMAGNREVIEVLHFIGARSSFIARQFQTRFLIIGLKGACAGGLAAIIMFVVTGFWARQNLASVEGEQVAAFFGDFSIRLPAYLAVLALIIFVGLLTAITTRLTVLNTLRDIDDRRANPSVQP